MLYDTNSYSQLLIHAILYIFSKLLVNLTRDRVGLLGRKLLVVLLKLLEDLADGGGKPGRGPDPYRSNKQNPSKGLGFMRSSVILLGSLLRVKLGSSRTLCLKPEELQNPKPYDQA